MKPWKRSLDNGDTETLPSLTTQASEPCPDEARLPPTEYGRPPQDPETNEIGNNLTQNEDQDQERVGKGLPQEGTPVSNPNANAITQDSLGVPDQSLDSASLNPNGMCNGESLAGSLGEQDHGRDGECSREVSACDIDEPQEDPVEHHKDESMSVVDCLDEGPQNHAEERSDELPAALASEPQKDPVQECIDEPSTGRDVGLELHNNDSLLANEVQRNAHIHERSDELSSDNESEEQNDYVQEHNNEPSFGLDVRMDIHDYMQEWNDCFLSDEVGEQQNGHVQEHINEPSFAGHVIAGELHGCAQEWNDGKLFEELGKFDKWMGDEEENREVTELNRVLTEPFTYDLDHEEELYQQFMFNLS